MGFPPGTSLTCWRKESASLSPPSAPLMCTWSWSNVRKTKRIESKHQLMTRLTSFSPLIQLKVRNIHWNVFQDLFFFFFFLRPRLAREHSVLSWPWARDHKKWRDLWPLQPGGDCGGGVTRCQLHLSIILAYLASKLQPLGLPVTLARPDTLYLRQAGEQQHAQRARVTLTCLFPKSFLHQ